MPHKTGLCSSVYCQKQVENAIVNIVDHKSSSVSPPLFPFHPPTQPDSIGHLVGLKDLWLDGNQLNEIPAVSHLCSFFLFVSLRFLIKISPNPVFTMFPVIKKKLEFIDI